MPAGMSEDRKNAWRLERLLERIECHLESEVVLLGLLVRLLTPTFNAPGTTASMLFLEWRS